MSGWRRTVSGARVQGRHTFRWLAAGSILLGLSFAMYWAKSKQTEAPQNRSKKDRSAALALLKQPQRGRFTPKTQHAASGSSEPSDWPISFDRSQLPDLSYLNRAHGPAGSHGRVLAKGEDLYFEDGTRARFWGTNVTARALFQSSRSSIQREAARLARLGYNLVRIHHHDSPWVEPNIFAPGKDTGTISDESFRRICEWVEALKAQGIYVWLDLHVGRKMKKGDRVTGWQELPEGDPHGFVFINPDLQARFQRFASDYLGRINAQSGLAFARDPAIAAVLISNENDLTKHFGNAFLPAQGRPAHWKMFRSLALPFIHRSRLPKEESLRTWQPGPAKIVLNELEHLFFQRAKREIRELGYEGLIATSSSWGHSSQSSLPSLTTGDIIDVHSYGEPGALGRNPAKEPNFIHWISSAQVRGYPLTVSEWNIPPPIDDRYAAPTYVASLAAHQGWDAVLLYAHQQYSTDQGAQKRNKWSCADDPALGAQLPAAALLFRRADVRQAQNTISIAATKQQFFGQELSPKTHLALRTLTEQSRVVIELPTTTELTWLQQTPATESQSTTGPFESFLPPGATQIAADTGQFSRDWERETFWFDAPKSQGASGRLGALLVQLSDVELDLKTAEAAIAVTALDDRPISQSGRLLVSISARAKTIAERLPYRSQPVSGDIFIRTDKPKCVEQIGSLERAAWLGHPEQGRLKLSLSEQNFAHWYLLTTPTAQSECSGSGHAH